jgi:hypothetical protein
MTVLVLALATMAACAEDNGTAGPGSDRTRVLLTDAPFPFDLVQSVDVHIVSIDAAATFDTTTTVEWTPLVAPDQRFNLLDLQDGATALLGEADVVATDYAAIRMVIRTDLSGITLTDGSAATVNWMGPATQTIHTGIEQPLSITDGPSDADLIIDFDVGRSFVVVPVTCDSFTGCPDQVSRPAFQFLPWIRAVNEDATGTISGTVRGTIGPDEALVPVPYANITVYRGTNSLMLAATGRADGAGQYRIHYVSGGGPYVIEALPPAGTGGGYGYARDVYVTPGQEATADVVLGTDTGGEEPAGRLEITGPNAVAVGESIYLVAFLFNENGDSVFGAAVTWQHSDPDVALLEGSGSMVKLTGLAAGYTSVVATAGDLMDSVVVTVGTIGAPLPVASVEVSPATATIAVGDSVGFQAILRDSTGQVLSNRVVSWTVDTSRLDVLASFGHYLIVRATASGAATIRATSEGKEGTGTVTVQ